MTQPTRRNTIKVITILPVAQLKWITQKPQHRTSGRPYGGTAILWNKKLNAKIFMNQDQSIIGLDVCLDSSSFNFINVYMAYCCDSNYDEYINYFSKISTLCEEIGSPNVFIVGTSMLALITILVYCCPNCAWNMN